MDALVRTLPTDRPWWSPALVERWHATATWNTVRSSVRRHEARQAARHAAWIAARPRRIVAVAQGSVFHARLRQRIRVALRAGVRPGAAPAAGTAERGDAGQ